METWIILSKLFIITYILLKTLLMTNSINSSFILIFLCYICITMFMYIVKNRAMKILLAFSSLILLFISFKFTNNLFILLMPLGLYEVFSLYYKNFMIIAHIISITQIFFLKEGLIPEYILILLLGSLINLLSIRSHEKINDLLKTGNELREKNYNLKNNLSKNLDYENQIKYMSQLEERNKIAQEIHDKIGHTIAGSLMQLEAAKVLLQRDKEEAENILQNSIDTLRVGMDNIRATLRNVKPPSEQIGINKIKLILDQFMLSSNIIGVLNLKGDLEIITSLQWKILQENILEALTNIIKHSNATKVSVNIEVLNKYIKCEVKDNGIGANKLVKGIGLIGFEERTEGAGGKVIIDGSAGFSVIFLLPVKI